MLGNDVVVFVRKFGPTHVRDIYSNISTSNSDERYGLPKSDESLSLVKFECGFVPLSCTFLTQNHFIDKIIVVIMCVLPWCLIVQPAFLIFVYNKFAHETI